MQYTVHMRFKFFAGMEPEVTSADIDPKFSGLEIRIASPSKSVPQQKMRDYAQMLAYARSDDNIVNKGYWLARSLHAALESGKNTLHETSMYHFLEAMIRSQEISTQAEFLLVQNFKLLAQDLQDCGRSWDVEHFYNRVQEALDIGDQKLRQPFCFRDCYSVPREKQMKPKSDGDAPVTK